MIKIELEVSVKSRKKVYCILKDNKGSAYMVKLDQFPSDQSSVAMGLVTNWIGNHFEFWARYGRIHNESLCDLPSQPGPIHPGTRLLIIYPVPKSHTKYPCPMFKLECSFGITTQLICQVV